jgi:CheY-like chemotaxis protein
MNETASSIKPEKKANPDDSDLAALLARHVVGQAAATKTIVPYVYMYQSGLAPEGRPAGVFLLLGPTGTGKTKTVEIVSGAHVNVSLSEDGSHLAIKPTGARETTTTQQPTILIVDDNRDLLLFLATQLEEEGWRLLTAEDADSARELFAGRRPDTVLVDYMLGRKDGLKLGVQFHQAAPEAQIIIMTGGGLAADEVTICEERGFPILYKPFLAEAVLSLVRSRYRRTSAAVSG